MPTSNITQANFEAVQKRVKSEDPAAFADALDTIVLVNFDPIVVTCSTQAFNDVWDAAEAAELAGDPLPIPGLSDAQFEAKVLATPGLGAPDWGDVGGTLSDQLDLQAALDGKQASGSYAAASHTHTASEVTDFSSEVDAAVAAYLLANPPSGGESLSVAQVRNSAATSNLNHGTAWADIVIDGIEDEMDTGFTNGTTGIVCNFTGRVKCTTHIGYTVAGSRVNCLVRAAVAGTGQGIEGKSGYVRNTTGHTEASATAIQYIDVTDGDEVTLQTMRESSATTSTPGDAGGCMILLERWA